MSPAGRPKEEVGIVNYSCNMMIGLEDTTMSKKTYFTLTGTKYYYGKDFLKPGMKLKLIKEPDNKYDTEAIRVEIEGLGKLGYVANSIGTVLGESLSAGRIYDRIGKKTEGKVVIVTDHGVVCKLCKK